MKKSIITVASIFLATITTAQNTKYKAGEIFLQAKRCYEYVKYDSAIALYTQAADVFKKNKENKGYFNCLVGTGQCYNKKNEFSKSLSYFNDLQAKSEKQFGKNTDIPATCMYYQGYANLYLNQMKNAESLINKALELRLKLFGENHADVAQSYNLLGQYFLFKGDFGKSLENFNKSLKIRENIFGKNHQDVANSLNNVSSVYYYLGFLDTAIYLANQSLKIKEQILPKDHPDFILSYNSLAIYQNDKTNYQEALNLHLKNLTLCEKYYGHLNPTTSTIYRNIGQTYFKLKDYKQALGCFEEAIKISKSVSKNENADLAPTYLSIGDVYDETFQYGKAIKIKNQALKIFIESLGEFHPNTALAHNSIAISFKNDGDFTKSIDHIEKALIIFTQTQDETNANSAMCHVNMGNIYLQFGQIELCIKHYEKAISIYNQLYGENSKETALVFNNIAEAYINSGEYEKSLLYLKESGVIYQQLLGDSSESILKVYKNIGFAHEMQGNLSSAIEYYQRALNICLKIFGEKNLTTASIYESLGKANEAKKDLLLAKTNYEKSFEIRREILTRKHYLLAYSLNDLGLINYKLGQYNQALDNFTFSFENNLKDYTPTGINYYKIPEIKNYQDINSILTSFKGKVIVFETLYNQDKKSLREKKAITNAVLDHIKACDQTIDIIRKSSIDEKDKLQVSANSVAVYDLAIQFCYLLFLDTKEQKYLELAFYYSEKLKSCILLEALAGSEAKKFANIPDSVINHEKLLDREIADLRKQLTEKGNYGIEDSLFKLENQKQNLIKYCETNYPKYFQLKYANNLPDIKAIQATLDEKTALISYYQTEKSVFQIVLTKTKVSFSSSDKFENFDQKIEELRYCIIHGDLKSNIEQYKQLASKFYELLFGQYLDKQIDKLIIIPTGSLANIPFEALLTSKLTGKQKFKDLPYLINKFNISYAYSANLYYLTSKKQKQDNIEISTLNDWLAFAPVFSDESTSGLSIRSRGLLNQINKSIDTLKTRSTLLNGNYVSPLPGTEHEVKSIFDEFEKQNKKAEIKIYQAANENFVKSEELRKYKYIHFATHGFVDSEKPELSGILLAQDTTGGNDGILFSGEIYNLELNADLVVLSACETGLGKIQSGEGIIGLTRALLYAGAKNIIVSLWQVSDEATSQLMVEFYAEMLKSNNQQNFSEYLRNAKLAMIKEGKFSHPFFWSPFILIGK